MKAISLLVTIFLLPVLIFPPFLRASDQDAIDSVNSRKTQWAERSVSGKQSIDLLLHDKGRKKELLAYAKKLFLARLGFAGRPSPPQFLKNRQHACFVTFFSGRKVIACFGGFYPRKSSIAAEIEENISMALRFDPRTRTINKETALAADVQITFPDEPETVESYQQVNPLHEGLLVENDHNGVAIVPGEAKTSSWAFREAMRRLGEKDASGVRLSRFRAFAVSSRSNGKSDIY